MRIYPAIVALIALSCRTTPLGSNYIAFEDPFEQVCDSISVMTRIMEGLHASTGIASYLVGIDGEFRLGGQGYSSPAVLLADTFRVLDGVPSSLRRRFWDAVQYLLKNQLHGCAWNVDAQTWIFLYRLSILEEEGDQRYVIPVTNRAVELNLKRFTIVDRRGGLVLVAPQGASIR